jgi:hypothetical protein
MGEDDGSFEQRPTRPLDLDPYRAQVPEENMEYIRHLGFSPPDAEEMKAQPDGHGWIYLNVLTNMAQLHFANVTPMFIQKAITEYSKMLELSPGGRKVRWKGGKDVTVRSSSNSPDQEVGMTTSLQQKRNKSVEPRSSLHTIEGSGQTRCLRHKLAYSPLFRSRDDSETEAGMDDDLNYQISSLQGGSPAGASSGAIRTLTR